MRISTDEVDKSISLPQVSQFDRLINSIIKTIPEFTQYVTLRDKYAQMVEGSEIQQRLTNIQIKLKNVLDMMLLELTSQSDDVKDTAQRKALRIEMLRNEIIADEMQKYEADLKSVYGESALQAVRTAFRRYIFDDVETSELKSDESEKARIANLSDSEKAYESRLKKIKKRREVSESAQGAAEKKFEEEEEAAAKAKELKDNGVVIAEKPKEEFEQLKDILKRNFELRIKASKAVKAANTTRTEQQKTDSQAQENQELNDQLRNIISNMVYCLTLNPVLLGYDYAPWDLLDSLRYLSALPQSIIMGYLGFDKETIIDLFDPAIREDIDEWLSASLSKTREIVETTRAKALKDEGHQALDKQLKTFEMRYPQIRQDYESKVLNEEIGQILAAPAQMKEAGWIVTYQPWEKFVEYFIDKRFSGYDINIEGSTKLFSGMLSSEDLKKRKQLHQGGMLGLWSGGMAAPMCLIRQKCEPDIFCPSGDEFNEHFRAWVNDREANAIGFFYSEKRSIWEAYLIVESDGKKTWIMMDINADSPFLPVLDSFRNNAKSFDKKKLNYLLRNNELFEGHPVGSQWMRAIVAFGAKYEQWQELVKKVNRRIRCMNWDLTIMYPTDSDEFNGQLESWRKSSETNAALFIYSAAKNAWVSYLIKNDDKDLEQKEIAASSPLMVELRGINASNVGGYDIERLNLLLLREQRNCRPHFASHQKVLKDGEFKETITGAGVAMRSVTENALVNINRTVNDTLPLPSASLLPMGSVIICDSDQNEEWFDFIIFNEKGQYATYNHREFDDKDVRVRHSGDKYINALKKEEQQKKIALGKRNARCMRQHIAVWPREKGAEASHVAFVSASYSNRLTTEKRRADIYICQPNAEQNARLAREMDAEVKNTGGKIHIAMRKEEYAIVDELTRDLDPASSVPSVEPFAESGAWGVMMSSIYYSPRHQRSFLIKWNMPLTFKVNADAGGFNHAMRLVKEDFQPVIDSPEFQKYLDELFAQKVINATVKGTAKDEKAAPLSKPLVSLHADAVKLAIKIAKEPNNSALKEEYSRLYKMLNPIVPLQDLPSILRAQDPLPVSAKAHQEPNSPALFRRKSTSKLAAAADTHGVDAECEIGDPTSLYPMS